ncbi:MAG: class I SAM-dependent methyltransferase [Phycisphaerales bacterium]|nr:MAG: class I SAM-dependent methyltransferase [Phycisphaerales bacterium]
MSGQEFDLEAYYASYPARIIERPGYPARAAFKSGLMWRLYGRELRRRLGDVTTYADIGGAFGFAANALAFHMAKGQSRPPQTVIFEIVPAFVAMGQQLFPTCHFVQSKFEDWTGEPRLFDLISLFDLLEHLVDPETLLRAAAARGRYLLLKTPMETTAPWLGSRPLAQGGAAHPDGHIQFFSPKPYEAMLDRCGLEILKTRLMPTVVPIGARLALIPERLGEPVPEGMARIKRHLRAVARTVHLGMPACLFRFARAIIGGGTHLSLCRSRLVDPDASGASATAATP